VVVQLSIALGRRLDEIAVARRLIPIRRLLVDFGSRLVSVGSRLVGVGPGLVERPERLVVGGH
jgi:hypothetical protein